MSGARAQEIRRLFNPSAADADEDEDEDDTESEEGTHKYTYMQHTHTHTCDGVVLTTYVLYRLHVAIVPKIDLFVACCLTITFLFVYIPHPRTTATNSSIVVSHAIRF